MPGRWAEQVSQTLRTKWTATASNGVENSTSAHSHWPEREGGGREVRLQFLIPVLELQGQMNFLFIDSV